jgi:hypothetical protein
MKGKDLKHESLGFDVKHSWRKVPSGEFNITLQERLTKKAEKDFVTAVMRVAKNSRVRIHEINDSQLNELWCFGEPFY